MTRHLIAVGAVVAGILTIVLWLGLRDEAAERRGMEKEIARRIARANQEIATRRETDASFDSMDARAHCLDAGLDWVFEDGRSLCR